MSNWMNWLDHNVCGEIALILFVGVFVATSLRALLLGQRESDRRANIPLNDGTRR